MEYWCEQTIAVHIEGPMNARDIVIPLPFGMIGSHPDAEVSISGLGIPKRAFYLHALPSGIFLLNLEAEHSPGQGGRWLTSNEVITIGSFRLQARLPAVAESPVIPPSLTSRWPEDESVPILNVFANGLPRGQRRLHTPLQVFGRHSSCNLQLQCGQVSLFHWICFWYDRQLWSIDLHSANGMLVNGRRRSCFPLSFGDHVAVGRFEFAFYRLTDKSETTSERPPPAEAMFTTNAASEVRMQSPPAGVKTEPLAEISILDHLQLAVEGSSSAGHVANATLSNDQGPHHEADLFRGADLDDPQKLRLLNQWEETSNRLRQQVQQLQHVTPQLHQQRLVVEQLRQDLEQVLAKFKMVFASPAKQLNAPDDRSGEILAGSRHAIQADVRPSSNRVFDSQDGMVRISPRSILLACSASSCADSRWKIGIRKLRLSRGRKKDISRSSRVGRQCLGDGFISMQCSYLGPPEEKFNGIAATTRVNACLVQGEEVTIRMLKLIHCQYFTRRELHTMEVQSAMHRTMHGPAAPEVIENHTLPLGRGTIHRPCSAASHKTSREELVTFTSDRLATLDAARHQQVVRRWTTSLLIAVGLATITSVVLHGLATLFR